MVRLRVDDSYAFEYYCILLVKKHFNPNDAISLQIEICKNRLVEQLGSGRFQKIVESAEFTEMFNVNCDTFRAVDLAKQDKLKASEVDAMTYKRKIAKDALQKAHFDVENLEVKIGY